MTTSVRSAVASDAAALVSIQAALSGSPSALQRTEHFAGVVERNPGRVFVAEQAGSVIGYLALLQRSHAAVESRSPIQLWQIYVVPPHHGAGAASRLMSAAVDYARMHSHDVMWLGVSQTNSRAVAFYRKWRFAPLGVHPVGEGDHAHDDLVMSRPIDAA